MIYKTMYKKPFVALYLILMIALLIPGSGERVRANRVTAEGPSDIQPSAVKAGKEHRSTADSTPDGSYLITGRVIDSGSYPIKGVTVTAMASGVSSDYQPKENGYNFSNGSRHTSWDIFRQTFGAENVEWTVGNVTVRKPDAQ